MGTFARLQLPNQSEAFLLIKFVLVYSIGIFISGLLIAIVLTSLSNQPQGTHLQQSTDTKTINATLQEQLDQITHKLAHIKGGMTALEHNVNLIYDRQTIIAQKIVDNDDKIIALLNSLNIPTNISTDIPTNNQTNTTNTNTKTKFSPSSVSLIIVIALILTCFLQWLVETGRINL